MVVKSKHFKSIIDEIKTKEAEAVRILIAEDERSLNEIFPFFPTPR